MNRTIFLVIIIFFISSNVLATNSPGSQMHVSATILPTCNIITSDINFGVFKSQRLQQAITYSIICTRDTPYIIEFGTGRGKGRGADYRNRFMENMDNKLRYAIFKDSHMKHVWGSYSNALHGVGTGKKEKVTIYTVIYAQDVPNGQYVDHLNLRLMVGDLFNAKDLYKLIIKIPVYVLVKNT